MEYPNLGLAKWPFSVVPDQQHCTFIGDRTQLREDLAELLAEIQRRDASRIHLFWAWYGAGKTHSLYFLANEIRRLGTGLMMAAPVYSEFSKAPGGFIDVYRTFIT